MRRPVASEERYRATMAVADRVDPAGRLACMLTLARYTGRRINALCQLRAEDVFLTRDQAVRALAAAGMDERDADHMRTAAFGSGKITISSASSRSRRSVRRRVPRSSGTYASGRAWARRRSSRTSSVWTSQSRRSAQTICCAARRRRRSCRNSIAVSGIRTGGPGRRSGSITATSIRLASVGGAT